MRVLGCDHYHQYDYPSYRFKDSKSRKTILVVSHGFIKVFIVDFSEVLARLKEFSSS